MPKVKSNDWKHVIISYVVKRFYVRLYMFFIKVKKHVFKKLFVICKIMFLTSMI